MSFCETGGARLPDVCGNEFVEHSDRRVQIITAKDVGK